jgi:hypothetical protein
MHMPWTDYQRAFANVLKPMAVNGSLPNDFAPPSFPLLWVRHFCSLSGQSVQAYGRAYADWVR